MYTSISAVRHHYHHCLHHSVAAAFAAADSDGDDDDDDMWFALFLTLIKFGFYFRSVRVLFPWLIKSL